MQAEPREELKLYTLTAKSVLCGTLIGRANEKTKIKYLSIDLSTIASLLTFNLTEEHPESSPTLYEAMSEDCFARYKAPRCLTFSHCP